MTNEQRERVYRLERYLLVDRDKIYTNVRVNDLDTVLSLIKENQTEIEIYKEELDSIYKALDIERGVARPRTYEIIQALKNTIKCQAKQINLMTDEIIMTKPINCTKTNEFSTKKVYMSKEEIKQYFAGLVEKE